MRPFRVFGDRDNSPELRGGERSGLGSDSSTHLDSALRSDDGNPEAIQRPEKSAAQNFGTREPESAGTGAKSSVNAAAPVSSYGSYVKLIIERFPAK